MRNILVAILFAIMAALGASPAAAVAVFGAQPTGAPPTYQNGQGGLAYSQGIVPIAPPAQPGGCVFMGSVACPMIMLPAGTSYTHIATSATTTIFTTSGHELFQVCVNKAGTAGSVVIDDAATATTPTVAILDSTVAICHEYTGVILLNGLTIVTTGAPDVTIVAK